MEFGNGELFINGMRLGSFEGLDVVVILLQDIYQMEQHSKDLLIFVKLIETLYYRWFMVDG